MPCSLACSRSAPRPAALVAAGLASLTLGGALAACARNPKPGQAIAVSDTARTTVRVQNQSLLDVNVYVLRSGSRVRLGTVTSLSTAVLTIPRALIAVVTPVRFISVPIGGNRAPVSEEITVSPGDQVGLLIPPG